MGGGGHRQRAIRRSKWVSLEARPLFDAWAATPVGRKPARWLMERPTADRPSVRAAPTSHSRESEDQDAAASGIQPLPQGSGEDAVTEGQVGAQGWPVLAKKTAVALRVRQDQHQMIDEAIAPFQG